MQLLTSFVAFQRLDGSVLQHASRTLVESKAALTEARLALWMKCWGWMADPEGSVYHRSIRLSATPYVTRIGVTVVGGQRVIDASAVPESRRALWAYHQLGLGR